MQRRTPPDPRATDYFRLSGRSAVLAAERGHRYCRQTRQRRPYGLAARGRTRDLARAHRLSSTLDIGTVNTFRAMSPKPPRAGFKHSVPAPKRSASAPGSRRVDQHRRIGRSRSVRARLLNPAGPRQGPRRGGRSGSHGRNFRERSCCGSANEFTRCPAGRGRPRAVAGFRSPLRCSGAHRLPAPRPGNSAPTC